MFPKTSMTNMYRDFVYIFLSGSTGRTLFEFVRLNDPTQLLIPFASSSFILNCLHAFDRCNYLFVGEMRLTSVTLRTVLQACIAALEERPLSFPTGE